ncbi:MAG TPA: xanthine dehydrogenase family protein molybdopterin-binding subunit [Solirubrobacteraceae bacterium]|nr:xanthine dehydrogenase family protein molybdopterin-binding subunit [Solirubrobacteraceae bacterium]
MSAPQATRFTGKSVRRVEDEKILSGRGRYVDDIRLPRMVHAVFLRSTVAHGRIVSLDVEQARTLDGVVAIVTGAELAQITNPMQLGPETPDVLRPVFTPLATDKVRYVGDPVALILAESRYAAEDARDVIFVEYDGLAPVATIEQAEDPAGPVLFEDVGSNVLYTESVQFGDPDAAFAGARVVRETFTPQRVAPVPMETRGGVADHHPGTGDLVYHAATQSPHALRLLLSGLLGQPAEQLRVITPDVGGAFGQKAGVAREDVAVCAASKLLGRPVKWVEDRVENMTSATHARSETVEIAAAVDDDGTILALDVTMKLDLGAYPILPFAPSFLGPIVRTMFVGPYRIENLRWQHSAVATNKASYGTYRGPWAVESLVRELLIDDIARELGLDAVDVRRRNLLRADEQPRKMITGPTIDGVSSLETLERAVELAGYEGFREEQRRARERGALLGVGFSTYIEPAPGPIDFFASAGSHLPPSERAIARLEPDGHLTVITAQAPHGQGHETTLAQVAATEFGIPLEHVRVVHGDTQLTPFLLIGTGGSRAATMASGAALHATRLVKQKVLAMAANMLEISPDDLEIVDAVVAPKGDPERGIPLAGIAMAAYFATPPGEDEGLRSSALYEQPAGGWSGGTHVCFVEVDPETGVVELLRYIVVEDCGDLINPAIVDGQIRGGVAQGIGIALLENALYDEDANFLAGTFMDYLMPTAMEIPTIEIEHVHGQGLAEVNSRGVGEGGTIAAPPAIANAVADALGGVRVTALPLTPERVLDLLDAAGGAA